MILFLFLILIILVTICIYKNYFSNQEGNTIYVADCSENQYIRDGVCKDISSSGCTGDDITKYTFQEQYLRNLPKSTSCKIEDYSNDDEFFWTKFWDIQKKTSLSGIEFEVDTSLLTYNNLTCKNDKKVKGNLYCKYNADISKAEIIGDISCVDVSDFKDVEWYRNVAKYSFEYTNDGSRNKLHYVCKNGTNMKNNASGGSILPSEWVSSKGKGKCNPIPEQPTIGEGGKNIADAEDITDREWLLGRWCWPHCT